MVNYVYLKKINIYVNVTDQTDVTKNRNKRR